MKMTKIKPNPNNPRKINSESLQRLKDSVEQFPKMMKLRPIVIDQDGMILGGNMRYLALKEMGWKEIPDEWVKIADELTPDEKRRFIIADNVAGGDWDWEILGAEWDPIELENWGLEIPGGISIDGFGDEFELPDGGKEPFQQMTFTLADEQAEFIKAMLKEAPDGETYGNENRNGNALYAIVSEWVEQKT